NSHNGSGTGNGSGSTSSGQPPQCDGPMGDPDAGGANPVTGGNPDPAQTTNTDPTTSTRSFLGKTSNMYANADLGVESHIPGKKHFASLFAEIHYGIPFSTTATIQAFNNTKTSASMSVNFGLSFGITR